MVPTYNDLLTWLNNAISSTVHMGDIFAFYVQTRIFPAICVIKVAQLGVNKALFHHGWEDTLQRFVLLLLLLASNFMCLQYWTQPFPFTSTTLPEAVNETASRFEKAVTQGTIEELWNDVDKEWNGIANFVVKQAGQWFDYFAARGVMSILELVAFGVIMFSYLGFTVGVILGPLMIPLMLFERTAGWFDRWLGAWIAFALMRVVAAIVVGVSALFMHSVFQVIPWWMWVTMMEKALLIVLAAAGACIYSMFKIPSLAREYFGGGIEGGLGSAAARMATTIVRFAPLA
jgi:hypothetical protein